MKKHLIICLAAAALIVAGGPGTTAESLSKAKAEYEALAKRTAQSVAYIGEPLKNLTDEQLASVAALLVMARVAAQSEGIDAKVGASFSKGFWVEVPEFCPPMPKGIERQLKGCGAKELAYAVAMSKCLEEKDESWCERENAGKLSAAVMCTMEQIEKMKGIIQAIGGRRWPPGPFPWPVGR